MVINGLLAISLLQGAASLVFFVLYLLLYPSCRERFFRYWLAGWGFHVAAACSSGAFGLWGGQTNFFLTIELALGASLFMLASILQYIGRQRQLHYIWPAGVVGIAALTLGLVRAPGNAWIQQSGQITESVLYLSAGWLLWRYAKRSGGYGSGILSASLLLYGLHKMDQGSWLSNPVFLLRVAFDALLALAAGVSMAVLVLEANRSRTEDLHAKLSRLTLMTGTAAETLRADQVLEKLLQHLVENLGVRHGFVRLLEGEGETAQLVLRASVGFNKDSLLDRSPLPACEPWTQGLLRAESSYVSLADAADPELRRWMKSERIAALAQIRVTGEERPLGILGVGGGDTRLFPQDEANFLVNAANLFGLTIQNIRHIEKAAIAERQWARTFDEMGDPILVHDGQYRLLRANQAVTRRLGAGADLLGKPMRELLRRGEARWNHCPYCEGAAGKAEGLDPSFGGYLLATTTPLEDPQGGRLGTIHVLRDITARKRAEEKYRTLFESVQEGLFVSTPEGRFIDFNDAFQRMLGYSSREDLMNVDISSTLFVNPADRERLKKLLREHGSVSGFEFTMRRRDGEPITVLESSFASRDASGAINAYQGFVLDITERKQAEMEIRRRNRELILLNAVGYTLSQPEALDELLGLSLRQIIELFGLDLGAVYLVSEHSGQVERRAAVGLRSAGVRQFAANIVPGELLRHLKRTRATVLAPQALSAIPYFGSLPETEGVQVARVVILWSKDRIIGGLLVGSRSRREFSTAELNLLAAVGNQIAGTIEKTTLYDETRQALENLRRTQEQLVQSEKMVALGQLISGVAHELNNPLTAILGYSQLLSGNEEAGTQVADFSNKITKQAHRTQRIVQNLLSFARQHKPERRPVQLNEVLEDTISLRDYDWRRFSIEIHRQLDVRLPRTAGDRHQLQQVFLNILNNAFDVVRGMPGERHIWISTRVQDLRLCVEVADSGPGVREPRRVFDPFYTTKAVGEGTGLGLSICYGIVKEHGGEISVRNDPPRGAVFTVTLPLSTSLIPEESPAPAVAEGLPAGSALLVDEEEAILDIERQILRERGLEIYTARSGAAAVDILEHHHIDLVVANWKLPGEWSGESLLEWIAQNRPGLSNRVVLTLSEAHSGDAQAISQQTGCATVHKPFRVEEFLLAVQRVMGETRASVLKG
jgi:PAS domain S-box-containing protein